MSKSLKVIQTLAIIAKILSKIIMVCCIVGLVGCVVGIVSLKVLGGSSYQLGNLTIHGIIEKSAEISIGTMNAAMAVGFVLCTGEAVLARSSVKFFDLELQIGTPFDFTIAKEMKSLGVRAIVIPLVSLMLAQVAYMVCSRMYSEVGDMHLDDYNSVGVGIAFLILSVLCRYGAELLQSRAQEPKDPAELAEET